VSDIVIVAIIVAIPPTLTALAGVFVSMRNSRKLEEVQKSTDGKMEKLLALTGSANKAEGVLQGKAEEKANPSP
jgi:hypothetical protein